MANINKKNEMESCLINIFPFFRSLHIFNSVKEHQLTKKNRMMNDKIGILRLRDRMNDVITQRFRGISEALHYVHKKQSRDVGDRTHSKCLCHQLQGSVFLTLFTRRSLLRTKPPTYTLFRPSAFLADTCFPLLLHYYLFPSNDIHA